MFELFVVSLGASISDLGTIAFVYAITGVFAGLFTGRISDRYNRKYVYAISLYRVACAHDFMFTMSSLGAIIGSLTGQYLWKVSTNTMPFFLSVIINLLSVLMILLFIKEAATKKRQT